MFTFSWRKFRAGYNSVLNVIDHAFPCVLWSIVDVRSSMAGSEPSTWYILSCDEDKPVPRLTESRDLRRQKCSLRFNDLLMEKLRRPDTEIMPKKEKKEKTKQTNEVHLILTWTLAETMNIVFGVWNLRSMRWWIEKKKKGGRWIRVGDHLKMVQAMLTIVIK